MRHSSYHPFTASLIYLRNVTPTYVNYNQDTFEPGLYPLEPLFDVTSLDIICGRNGTHTGLETKIADVIAGSEIGFAVNQGVSKIAKDIIVGSHITMF